VPVICFCEAGDLLFFVTMPDYDYYVYIMASKSRVLYTGMTNNLFARVLEHKSNQIEGFTKRFRVHRLVYFESFNYVLSAITREKEIKHWVRQRRVALIESKNPTWEDLAERWFTPERLADPKAMIYDAASIQTFSTEHEDAFRVPRIVPEERVRIKFRPAKVQSFGIAPKPLNARDKE
jgi:putative endonuclease